MTTITLSDKTVAKHAKILNTQISYIFLKQQSPLEEGVLLR